MIEAWFSASEITASSGPSSGSNSPPLASKQAANRIESSLPRKAASFCSSSRCMSCVPQMNRTEAMPNPFGSIVSRATRIRSG